MDRNEDIKVGSLLLFEHEDICNLWIVLKIIAEDRFELYCLRRNIGFHGQRYVDRDPFRLYSPKGGPYYKLVA